MSVLHNKMPVKRVNTSITEELYQLAKTKNIIISHAVALGVRMLAGQLKTIDEFNNTEQFRRMEKAISKLQRHILLQQEWIVRQRKRLKELRENDLVLET